MSTISTIFPIKIVLPAVAVLCVLFLIVLIIYFRVKNQSNSFSPSTSALDKAVVNAIPITGISSSNSDCAICLGDLTDGDLGRLLPGCNHVFHLHCIDEWFLVNSTCPTCRTSVDPLQKQPTSYSGANSASFLLDAANKGTKVGTLQGTSSSTSAAAPVESAALGPQAGEMRPPPMASLRWLKRLMSSSCSSIRRDVEQGGGDGGRS